MILSTQKRLNMLAEPVQLEFKIGKKKKNPWDLNPKLSK